MARPDALPISAPLSGEPREGDRLLQRLARHPRRIELHRDRALLRVAGTGDELYGRPDALGRDPRKGQGDARRQIRPARFPRHRLVGGRDADRGARGRDRPLGGATNRLTPARPAPPAIPPPPSFPRTREPRFSFSAPSRLSVRYSRFPPIRGASF